jgi:hypothetical protein
MIKINLNSTSRIASSLGSAGNGSLALTVMVNALRSVRRPIKGQSVRVMNILTIENSNCSFIVFPFSDFFHVQWQMAVVLLVDDQHHREEGILMDCCND